jgi:hypothetical protein
MVDGVLAAESSYEHWGLLHRLQRVLELLDNAEAAGQGGLGSPEAAQGAGRGGGLLGIAEAAGQG